MKKKKITKAGHFTDAVHRIGIAATRRCNVPGDKRLSSAGASATVPAPLPCDPLESFLSLPRRSLNFLLDLGQTACRASRTRARKQVGPILARLFTIKVVAFEVSRHSLALVVRALWLWSSGTSMLLPQSKRLACDDLHYATELHSIVPARLESRRRSRRSAQQPRGEQKRPRHHPRKRTSRL
uniref:Uncharacterized protein n=1 Tax=Anopheles merus TaxID=30066 RepID=A0A182ULY6_ANOME